MLHCISSRSTPKCRLMAFLRGQLKSGRTLFSGFKADTRRSSFGVDARCYFKRLQTIYSTQSIRFKMGLDDSDRNALNRMKPEFYKYADVIVNDLLPRLDRVLTSDDIARVEYRGNTDGWVWALKDMLQFYETRATNLSPMVAALKEVNMGEMAEKLRNMAEAHGLEPDVVGADHCSSLDCRKRLRQLESKQKNNSAMLMDLRQHTYIKMETIDENDDVSQMQHQVPSTQAACASSTTIICIEDDSVEPTTSGTSSISEAPQPTATSAQQKEADVEEHTRVTLRDRTTEINYRGSDGSGSDGDEEPNARSKTTPAKAKNNPNKNTMDEKHSKTTSDVFGCEQCTMAFSSADDLQQHIQRTHEGEKPFECTECGKTFNYPSYLNRHKLTHSGEKPFKCTECGETFNQSSNLNKHKLTHSGEKPFKCTECGETFNQSSNLNKHKLTHSGVKPFECTECGKKFSDSSTLKKHILTHSGEKPFECTECGKTFSQSSNLNRHKLTHSGKKPFECTECGKKFSQSSTLKKHILTHSGKKPFECTECGKTFSRSSNLNQHILTHSGEKPFECTECGKTFSRSSNLNQHKRRIHGKICLKKTFN